MINTSLNGESFLVSQGLCNMEYLYANIVLNGDVDKILYDKILYCSKKYANVNRNSKLDVVYLNNDLFTVSICSSVLFYLFLLSKYNGSARKLRICPETFSNSETKASNFLEGSNHFRKMQNDNTAPAVMGRIRCSMVKSRSLLMPTASIPPAAVKHPITCRIRSRFLRMSGRLAFDSYGE